MKLAEAPPTYCAACHGAYPDRKHVDFEAYFDGPVIKEGPEDNTIQVAIDDLIICETCMEAAANVLGFIKDDEIRGKVAEQSQMIIDMQGEIDQLNKEKRDLTHTIDFVAKHPPKATGGRPRVVDEVIPEVPELSEVS